MQICDSPQVLQDPSLASASLTTFPAAASPPPSAGVGTVKQCTTSQGHHNVERVSALKGVFWCAR